MGHKTVHLHIQPRDKSKGNLPLFLVIGPGTCICAFKAAGHNLWIGLEGGEGCSSSAAATVCC